MTILNMIKPTFKYIYNTFQFFMNYFQKFNLLFILILNKVNYKEIPIVNGYIFLRCNGIFNIGQNLKLNSNLRSNPIGGDEKCKFIIAENAILSIGNNVGISNSTIYCCKSIIIEDNVFIGGSTKIYDTDFHSLNFEKRISKDDDIKHKPIMICKNVFIGAHSIILKGVKIGEASIIGAGSVVTKNIPKNEIWAGNPAKFIKEINLAK